MKRVLALFLTLLLLLSTLTACGSQETVDDTIDFDTTRYSLSTAMSGVQFIYPKELDNNLVSYDTYDSYAPAERYDLFFEYVNGGTYSLFQPGNFGIYCFSVGDINHLEGKNDVDIIDHYLGISSYLTFSARGDQEYRSVAAEDGTIKNTFDVEISDHMIDEVFYGYLTVLKRGSDASIYAFVVGFANEDEASMQEAAEIADSFTLCSSNM